MQAYLNALKKVSDSKGKLASMRSEYSRGNRSAADLILQAEKQLDAAEAELVTLRNAVITAEQ